MVWGYLQYVIKCIHFTLCGIRCDIQCNIIRFIVVAFILIRIDSLFDGGDGGMFLCCYLCCRTILDTSGNRIITQIITSSSSKHLPFSAHKHIDFRWTMGQNMFVLWFATQVNVGQLTCDICRQLLQIQHTKNTLEMRRLKIHCITFHAKTRYLVMIARFDDDIQLSQHVFTYRPDLIADAWSGR